MPVPVFGDSVTVLVVVVVVFETGVAVGVSLVGVVVGSVVEGTGCGGV